MNISKKNMYSKHEIVLSSLRANFVIYILILCTTNIQFGMQNKSVWIPIRVAKFKATSYPPAAKNNPKEIICTFKAAVKHGKFIDAKLMANKNTLEFPVAWFNKTINSIEMDYSFNLSETEFQIRFASPANIVGAPDKFNKPITLFYRKLK